MTGLESRHGTRIDVRPVAEDAERLRDLVDTVDGNLWEADARTFEFTFVSRGAEALLGFPREAWTDVASFWADRIHPADRAWAVAFCKDQTEAAKDHTFEYRMIRADGRVVWVRDVVFVVKDAEGRPAKLRGLMTDVTAQRGAAARLSAQHAVATLMATARSLPRAAPAFLRALGENLGYDVGNVWTVQGDGLRHLASWTAEGFDPAAFLAESRRRRFAPGEGLPGTAWQDRRVTWVEDVAGSGPFPRLEAAREAGLVSGLAFPVRFGETVHAVVELFARERQARDEDLEQALEVVASQLGLFVERTRATAEAERQRARLDALVRSVPGVVWETWGHPEDPPRVDFVSEHVERMIGRAPEDFLADPGLWRAVVHPDDRERLERTNEEVFASGGSGVVEFRWMRKDGTPIWVSAWSTATKDADGNPVGLRGVTLDISARRRAEAALKESEERYRFMADFVPHQVWTALPDGRLDHVNARTLQYFGRSFEEVVGDGWQSVVHADDLVPCVERWKRSLSTGEPYEMEFRLRAADGAYRWHIARAVPQRDASGRIVKWFGSNTDITEHKETQRALTERAQDLAALAEALERSNRELDQFAYITSHDLKAPLRGIANLSRWIEEDMEGKLSEEAERHFDLLRGRVNRMEALIDAILQYSRVGRVRAAPERVDTGALLAEVADLLAPPEGFRVEVAEGMPVVLAERTPLHQVFLNLVGNAIKHHDRAEGVVRVEAEDAGDAWRFTVSDDGPGIPARFHDKVFVIFQTLQARDKREGTGIGLALVKKIVESQGGSIALESDGRGTTFRFTWPKRPRVEGENK